MDVLQGLRASGASVVLRGPDFERIEARRTLGGAPTVRSEQGDDFLDREEAELVMQLATLSLVTRRVLRRVMSPTGQGVEVANGAEVLIRYYANSIIHHLEGGLSVD